MACEVVKDYAAGLPGQALITLPGVVHVDGSDASSSTCREKARGG
jgi:hypothetical protein